MAATTARWRELITPALAPRAGLIMLGVWLNAADALVTVTVMPSVARDLGGFAYFGWAVAGYLLGSILAGASAGQLSRRLGLRAAMVLAAVAYAGGCVASAASPGIALFLIGRVVQGVGSGWIVGFCYVAIGVVFPERLWARMFGAVAGVWGVAALLGPLVGGLFAAAGLWRGAFWMFAAQGAAFALCAVALLPGARRGDEAHRPLAWRTLAVLAAAIGSIAAADVAAGGLWPAALVALGLVLLALTGAVNARPGERLLPRDAGRPATTAGAGYAMILAMEAATAVLTVYEAAILQTVWGLSPLTAGYAVAALAVGWTAAAFLVSGQPERRHGAFIMAGASAIVAGMVLMALTIAGRRLWPVIAGGAGVGVGFGLAWSFVASRILTSLPAEDRAVGASAVPTAQIIGAALGAAAAGAVANLLGLAHAFTPERAAAAAPWLIAAFLPVAALGWLAALRIAKKPRQPGEG